MIDPRRYDAVERLAMAQVGDWRVIRTFRPNLFESVGFPVRIHDLGELAYMLSSMSDGRSTERSLREIRGLRPADITVLLSAINRYIRYYATHIDSARIRIPVHGFVQYFTLYRKLKQFPTHASILDIGSGVGLLPFFIQPDDDFETYNQIEVTQSLYILQSSINSFVYQETQRECSSAAIVPGDTFKPSGIHQGWGIEDGIELDAVQRFRCTLFPWWQIPQAFAQKYDIVMSNENICEMQSAAFVFFMQKSIDLLKPNGMLLIHGIGKTTGDQQKLIEERFGILSHLGYRAVVSETSFENGGSLCRPNLILVQSGHEQYEGRSKNLFARNFDPKDPLIRAVYGLDEPDGAIRDVDALRAELQSRLADT